MNRRLPLALILTTCLAACGGGSSGSNSKTGSASGAGTTGSSTGSTTGGTTSGGSTTGATTGSTTGATSGGTTTGGTSGSSTGSSTGGGTTGSTSGGSTTGSSTGGSTGGTTTGGTTGSTTGGSTGGGTTGSTSGGTTGGTTGGTSGGTTGGTSGAAKLAVRLGRANRFLVGLGGSNDPSTVLSQGLHVDLYDRYLSDNPGSSWVDYNSPQGSYINNVTRDAESVGAVPMFTLYQMAVNGDGNLSLLSNQNQMQTYWQHVVLMVQYLANYNKPAVVNFEPDFWGYAMQQSGNDATKLAAYVNVYPSIVPECTSLPNTVVGVGNCLINVIRARAPKLVIGFPPSNFGASDTQIIAFMNQVGAAKADYIVMQTLDRDAGCFEKSPQPSYCTRSGSGWYWDESNVTHPNFHDHFAQANAWHTGIGNLPLIWWQTPQGVPSSNPQTGTANHYRDNRTHYFLTHASEMTAVGGLGAVFSNGENNQTTISTDNTQFQTLYNAYLANPTPLP